MDMIKITIDNKVVEVAKGTTILKAAKDNNISISAISYYCKHQKPQSSTYKNWRFARLSS